MTRATAYRALRIPDSARTQISGFTRSSSINVYQGAMRREMARLGYTDRRITLADKEVLGRLSTEADNMASAIVSVTNQMLQEAIDKLPDGLTDLQTKDALQSFFDGTRAYNRDTLIPYQSDWSASQAHMDFYRRNGVEGKWYCTPQSAECPVCQAAVDASPMTADDAAGYDMPNHRGCEHGFEVVDLDPSTLPAEADLWTGE